MSKKILLAALTALPLIAGATEYRVVDRPRQECWNEQVPVRAVGPDYGGALIGGIAGGLLGNQIGGGSGRVIATAVGAMTGAVAGDRMSNGAPAFQNVQRCRTVVDQVRVPVPEQAVPVIAPDPVYLPQPVYAQPQPVYVQQQPVYIRPRPVYVQTRPVVVPSGYYVVPRPHDYDGDHWRHRWHEHHWHDDDDD